MKRPFRFWMTGCVAVVMAALGGTAGALPGQRSPQLFQSRYGMAETVQRIEARAHEHGLAVFARLASHSFALAEHGDQQTVIVFASMHGGTPVLMESAEAEPDVPLSVCVRCDDAGGAQVMIAGADWEELPADVARDLTELPMLVADALS